MEYRFVVAESECLPVGQENGHQGQSQLGRGQGGKVAGPQVEDLREGLIDDSSLDLESAAHGLAQVAMPSHAEISNGKIRHVQMPVKRVPPLKLKMVLALALIKILTLSSFAVSF